jgi:hypothetical protein
MMTGFNFGLGPLAYTVAGEMAVGVNQNRIMSTSIVVFYFTTWAISFTALYLYYDVELGPWLGLCMRGRRAFLCCGRGSVLGRRVGGRRWKFHCSSPRGSPCGSERGMFSPVTRWGRLSGLRETRWRWRGRRMGRQSMTSSRRDGGSRWSRGYSCSDIPLLRLGAISARKRQCYNGTLCLVCSLRALRYITVLIGLVLSGLRPSQFCHYLYLAK